MISDFIFGKVAAVLVGLLATVTGLTIIAQQAPIDTDVIKEHGLPTFIALVLLAMLFWLIQQTVKYIILPLKDRAVEHLDRMEANWEKVAPHIVELAEYTREAMPLLRKIAEQGSRLEAQNEDLEDILLNGAKARRNQGETSTEPE